MTQNINEKNYMFNVEIENESGKEQINTENIDVNLDKEKLILEP